MLKQKAPPNLKLLAGWCASLRNVARASYNCARLHYGCARLNSPPVKWFVPRFPDAPVGFRRRVRQWLNLIGTRDCKKNTISCYQRRKPIEELFDAPIAADCRTSG